MGEHIESKEFRMLARKNCYKYGCLYVYMDKDISLDKHAFPHYRSNENSSALEKFFTLMQGLGGIAKGNDPLQKMPRTLPVVKWEGDTFEYSMSLNGTMYFVDYDDYKTCKQNLNTELHKQGWTVSSGKVGKMPVTSYTPTNNGSGSLYADDPIDAAGMAMMANAMQHTTAELEITEGLMTHDVQKYASGMARKQGRETAESKDLAGFGLVENMKAGMEAAGANSAGGIMGKWKTAGHPIQLIIDGKVAKQSVPGVLTQAEFTETAFVVDSSSGGYVYPTQMEVSISITNMYGSLFTTMTDNRSSK